MANYVYNKVVIPKKVYELYFQDENSKQAKNAYSEYNLRKLLPGLTDISKRRYTDNYIWYNEFHPFIDKGSTVELYFENRWEYPIRSIVNLFKKCPSEDIKWFCVEENDIYISCFTISSATHKLFEAIYYLDKNKKFDKLLGEFLDNEQIYESKPDFTEIEWYYKPEDRPGWQASHTDNLYDFYADKAIIDLYDEIKKQRIPWTTIKPGKYPFKFCIEGYTHERGYIEEGFNEWVKVSWIFYQGGRWHQTNRSQCLYLDDVVSISESLDSLLSGQMSEPTTEELEDSTLEISYVPGTTPKVVLKFTYFYDFDIPSEYKVTLSGSSLKRFSDYFNKTIAK